MRRSSLGKQFVLSVVLGVGMAVASCGCFMGLVWLEVTGHWTFALVIVLPLVMGVGAVASGIVLRLMADRSWTPIKGLLATPALYLSIFMFTQDLISDWLAGGLWPLGLMVLAVTWPITCLAFWIGRRVPDPDAGPTCGKCGYNLTGNESGICPECGTPVEAYRPSEASG
jgi:hypothetical protein